MGVQRAQKPAPPPKTIPPVTEEDSNIKLASQYEADRMRRQRGSQQNKLISPVARASSGNLLLSQTGTRQ